MPTIRRYLAFCFASLLPLLLGISWHSAVATAADRASELYASDLAETNLLPMSSREARSVQPSTFDAVQNAIQLSGQEARFQFRDSIDDIQIRFTPEKLTANAFPVSVTSHGKPIEPVPLQIGFRALVPVQNGLKIDPKAAVSVENCVAEKQPNGCRWRCELRIEGRPELVPVTIEAKPVGKSVRLQINAPANCFHGTTLQRSGVREVPATYRIWPSFYHASANLYSSAFVDLWHSNFRHGGSTGSRYDSLSDGTYRPLQDVYYITFSSRYEETISNVPHEPSPFLQELAGRVLLDLWGHPFAQDRETLETLSQYGVDRLWIIKHNWQRDGYDRSYPNVFPANAKQGGDVGLRELTQLAKSLGHRFCVHENFYDYYPNAEDFREADCSLNPDGAIQGGWDQGPVTAKALKPTKLMDYAKRFSPEIVRRYGCNAAYHDIMPSWRADFDVKVPNSGMIRFTHAITRELCDYDRKLFNGPVLFEAADNQMAGVYDGGTASLTKIENMPFLPITELLKVHPKMSNHGMSYYERWLEWGYATGWNWYLMTNRERDKYRAMTIAFGRTGFIGTQLTRTIHGMVREYNLMQAFAHAYTGQQVVRLRYLADGQWIDPGTAARLGKWQRLNATYEGNQEVYVNAGDSPWTIEGVTLPQYGTLTRGPRATAWTALIDGQIADYAHYDDTTYVDARSHTWLPDPVSEVSVKDFKDLGNGKFQLSLTWKIPKMLEGNYRIFQHYRDEATIAFQRDYYPKKRTSDWSVGEAICDGPITITIPAKVDPSGKNASEGHHYKLIVGLYDKNGRVPLAGGMNELQLGTLHVSANQHSVTFESNENTFPRGTDPAPYMKDLNRERRVLHFPGIATNGAVVLKHANNELRVIPVPSNETITIGLPGNVSDIQDENGRRVSTSQKDGWAWFETDGKSKSYRVTFSP